MNLQEKCEFLEDVSDKTDFGDEMEEYAEYWKHLAGIYNYVGYRENSSTTFREAYEIEVDDNISWIKDNLRLITKTETRTIEENIEQVIYYDEFTEDLKGYTITELE